HFLSARSELGEEEVDGLVEEKVAAPQVDGEDDRRHQHDHRGADHLVAVGPGDLLHLRVGLAEEVTRGEPPFARLRYDRIRFFVVHRFPGDSSVSGRPRGARTPNLRFWRPLLYQLSYWPASAAKACKSTALTTYSPALFRLPVNRVLPIVTAELLELQLLRHRLLVLRRRIVPTFALGALERD